MKKKRISLIILSITILVIGYLFLINYNLKNDLLAVYLDNARSDEIPSKSSNYIIDRIVCDDDVKASWDNVSWSLSVNNLGQKTKCNLYFKSKKDITITYDNNYVKNNIFESTYDVSKLEENVISSSNTKYTLSKYNGNNYYKFSSAGDETNILWANGYYHPLISNKLPIGYTYTLRFEARGNKDYGVYIGSEQTASMDSEVLGIRTFVKSEWQKYSYVITTNETKYSAFVFYGWVAKNEERVLEVRNIEFQEGEYDNYSNVKLKEYDILGSLSNPTRSGYTFLGWYTDPIDGDKIDSSTLVTEDTTYYAHWQYNG